MGRVGPWAEATPEVSATIYALADSTPPSAWLHDASRECEAPRPRPARSGTSRQDRAQAREKV
jgi:hypothetical protein